MFYFLFSCENILLQVLYSHIFGAVIDLTDSRSTNISGSITTGEEMHPKINDNSNPIARNYGFQYTSTLYPLDKSAHYECFNPNIPPPLFTIQTYPDSIDPLNIHFQGPNNFSISNGIEKTYNVSQTQYFPVKPIQSIEGQNNPSSQMSHHNIEFYIPQTSYQELQHIFNSVLYLNHCNTHSILPEVIKFLCNNYFFHDFSANILELDKLNSIKIYHSKFFENISTIENKLNAMDSKFGQISWAVFTKEFQNINLFMKTDEILSIYTPLISLKEFIYNNLSSVNISRRCCITMFIGMKSIESILILTRNLLRGIFNRYKVTKQISKYFDFKRKLFFENCNLISEIINTIFSLGLNLSQDFFIVFNIMKIGIRERNYRSFITRTRSNNKFCVDFVADLIFYFDSNEIKNIADVFRKSTEQFSNQVKIIRYKIEDFHRLEEILSTEEFMINIIKYYHFIFQNSRLRFLSTDIQPVFIYKEYILLLKRYEKSNSPEEKNITINQYLNDLRFDTFYFFHFVINYCHNYRYCSKKFLRYLKEPYMS